LRLDTRLMVNKKAAETRCFFTPACP